MKNDLKGILVTEQQIDEITTRLAAEITEDYKDSDGWSASRLVNKNIIDFDYLMNLEKHGFIEFITYKENDRINIDDMEISFRRNPH